MHTKDGREFLQLSIAREEGVMTTSCFKPKSTKKGDAMNSIVVLSLMILVQGTSGCTDKDAVPRLPDLQRRATTHSANLTSGEQLVNDFYLNPGWYSVLSYTMATNSTIPEVGACGTLYPIYIAGNPENSTIPNNTEVSFVACLRSYFGACDLKYNIKIRRCDGDLQYYLTDTERNAAYCFSPSGTGPSGIPTDVNLGEITVKPILRFDQPGDNLYDPFLEVQCKFNQQPDYFYHVKWYRNNDVIVSLGPSQNVSHLFLNETLAENLGVNFQCGVSVSVDEDGYQTLMKFSAKYFAGIKFKNLTVWLSKSSDVAVTFKITVPIGCQYSGLNPDISCCHDLRMFDRNDTCNKLVTQGRCGVRIPCLKEGETWDPDKEYNISILTKDETYADGKHFTLNFRTQRTGHTIWRNYQPESVNVIVTDTEVNKHKYCYSHVDPHMKTSDGTHYEQQRVGTFILYRNNKYNIEVQEQTHKCNRERATCTCGVIIRAGADVLMFNTCGRLQFIEFKECNDGGILRTKRLNSNLFQVHTPIGTYIQIRLLTGLYHKSMNIDIFMSPKDYKNTDGLCGSFDRNGTNDLRTRDGDDRPNNRDYVFSESWRLNSTDPENMFRLNYTSPRTWSQENNFCYCDNSESETRPEPTCSAKEFENCTITDTNDVTIKWCTLVSARKRRSISQRLALNSEVSPQRTKRSAVNITDNEANTTCTNVIGSVLVATDFTELLAPGEVEAKIEQCIFDVLASGDTEAAIVHVDALNEISTFHMDIDPEYFDNNSDRIAVFKQQSCPRNCSNQGTCVEGECQCVDHFHGADCSIDERNAVTIDGVTDDGVCDKVNSDCNCFHVQTDNLIETFKFQYVKSEMDENETFSLIESISGNGDYLSLFEGIVCFDSPTNQQAFVTHYNLSISNDGITYSDPVEIYVYDSTCLQYTTDANGRYNFNVMNGHCFISGLCYNENDKSQDNACNVCLPTHDTTNWTSACAPDKGEEDKGEEDKGEEDKGEEDKSFVIIIGGVVGGIAAIAVVGVVVYCVKKSRMKESENED